MMEGRYDLLFLDGKEGTFKCSFCERVIHGNESVERNDK